MSSPSPNGGYARYALIILFLINALNYIDRNILAALLPLIRAEFGASDAWLGLLGSSFIWVYMFAAIAFGYVADRSARNRIVSYGVGLWSAATACSGFAGTFGMLFACRALVGVGEAAYSSASPAMIADYFPPARRNRALSLFYIAMPVGSGLGYVLGGWLGDVVGWRRAFYFAGAPGALFAVAAWSLHEPQRGRYDLVTEATSLPFAAAVRCILRIRSYLWTTAGQILLTFSLGGVAVWLPTYFVRIYGMSLNDAGAFCGGALILGSLIGTVVGGRLADAWNRRSRNGLIHTISTGLAIGALLLPWFFFVRDPTRLFLLLVTINFFLFWHTGPINTLIANVAPPTVRATAVSLQILLIHLLGDAFSPGLIGLASDALQARGIGEADALRAVLMVLLPAPLLLSAMLTQVGTRWAPQDIAAVVGPHPLDASPPPAHLPASHAGSNSATVESR
ncbi:MAG TPA: MFS transporter [Candidatus Binatia bacterium]|nr:MFS transporter [Candidatus Binatia bacterium]